MTVAVVTSSTRPSSVSQGQHIYETDTGKTMVWNGTAWYPPWSTAWGVLGRATLLTLQSNIGASNALTDVTGMSVTVTVPAGRRIKLSAHGTFQITSAGGFGLGIFREGSTILQRWADRQAFTNNENGQSSGFVTLTPTAGSHTYKLTMAIQAGPGSLTVIGDPALPVELIVEDVGPA